MTVTPAASNIPAQGSHRTMILAGIAVPFAASKLIGPWAAPLLPALFGAACAFSVARHRPLLAEMAAKRAATSPRLATRLGAAGVSDALATMTVVWAVVLLGEAATLAVLASSARSVPFSTLNAVLTWGVQAILVAATIGYVRHHRIAAQATR